MATKHQSEPFLRSTAPSACKSESTLFLFLWLRPPTHTGAKVKRHPPLCHPERSRGTCGAPFPQTTACSSFSRYSLSHGNAALPLSSRAKPRDLRCALPLNNCPQLLPPLFTATWKRRPPLVIPSEAEGPAVRPSPKQLPAAPSAAIHCHMETPPSPCHPERSRGTCSFTFGHSKCVMSRPGSLFLPLITDLRKCSKLKP